MRACLLFCARHVCLDVWRSTYGPSILPTDQSDSRVWVCWLPVFVEILVVTIKSLFGQARPRGYDQRADRHVQNGNVLEPMGHFRGFK